MASVDYFLKIDGIKGESGDSKHKDEIDVLSWSWGETQQGASAVGGGGGAGKVAMQDFHFTKRIDKASAPLLLACASGQHIKTVDLVCRKAGKDQQEYLVIKMTDILVSSYQTGGSAGGDNDALIDSVVLSFSTIEGEYRPQRADGTLGTPVVFQISSTCPQ